MGPFANAMFNILLGWVQTAASWLWGLVTNADVSAWLHWLLENWLPLTILLCVAGGLIDFVVYLVRWQPYRVWRRFLHRQQEEVPEDSAPQPLFRRKWVYADGSTEVEHVHYPAKEQDGLQQDQLDAPIRPVRRSLRQASQEEAYHQPVYPPQWRNNIQDDQGENE